MSKPTRTFFFDQPLVTGVCELRGREAEHAAGSFRLGPGDGIRLIDGTGKVGHAEIQQVLDRVLRVRIREVEEPEHPHRLPRVTLAFSVPKDRRMDWLVEKCTELGVQTLVPVEFRNSVVRERPGRHEKSDKWLRIAREAAKQCGRPELPGITGFTRFADLMTTAADEKILLDPRSELPLSSLAARSGGRRVLVAVGPEGGLDPSEIASALESGFTTARISPFTLKIETAAVAAASVLMSGHAAASAATEESCEEEE